MIDEFKPGWCISGCLIAEPPVKERAERIDWVSDVLCSVLSVAKATALLLPRFCPGDGEMSFPDTSGAGTYMVFRTSLRPRTVPAFRDGVVSVDDRRVLATFDRAACASAASSSRIGSFLMSSLNCGGSVSFAASCCACEIGSLEAIGSVNPSESRSVGRSTLSFR
jgi:hypothetical protein